ncbi:MAG: transcription termination factor NusA [Holosporales bacterium]|nr:transcription termination factor NusA [Holosporales bacterium]
MNSRKVKGAEKAVVKPPRHELLQVAEVVAREKGIEIDEALEAMEAAVQKIAKTKYGADNDIRVGIDRTTGEISVKRVVTVVASIDNEAAEISIDEARAVQADVEVGSEFVEELPPIDFVRSAAQVARQIIVQKVREAERSRQYTEFVERKGEIVSGVVKQVDYGQVIVEVGKTEGVINKNDNIPRQMFKMGDRIKALLVDIQPESSGPMLILSRTNNNFIKKLFEQEVTEVYDGLVKIVAVARDPGSRAKVAVYSADQRVDAVGACVGVRGNRVQSVTSEIHGEKIDIIQWSSDTATYIMNALSLQEIKRVVIDEAAGKIEVIVDDGALSQAIGRRGQNVRLASMLTKWRISVVSQTDDAKKRAVQNATAVNSLVHDLEIDEMMARLLISEGFLSADDIAQSELEDFSDIEGLDEAIAKELRERAIKRVDEQEEKFFNMCQELGIGDDLLTLEGLDVPMFIKLIDAGIRTRDDVADLSNDELVDIVGATFLSLENAGDIIMDARKAWFVEEDVGNAEGKSVEGDFGGSSGSGTDR